MVERLQREGAIEYAQCGSEFDTVAYLLKLALTLALLQR
jgi:hypothetical protein